MTPEQSESICKAAYRSTFHADPPPGMSTLLAYAMGLRVDDVQMPLPKPRRRPGTPRPYSLMFRGFRNHECRRLIGF